MHVDFAVPVRGKLLFIAVDAHSKWPEAVVMNSTTASQVILVLWNLFAHYGLPEQLVSDNGLQFVSDEFQHFLATNGMPQMALWYVTWEVWTWSLQQLLGGSAVAVTLGESVSTVYVSSRGEFVVTVYRLVKAVALTRVILQSTT